MFFSKVKSLSKNICRKILFRVTLKTSIIPSENNFYVLQEFPAIIKNELLTNFYVLLQKSKIKIFSSKRIFLHEAVKM